MVHLPLFLRKFLGDPFGTLDNLNLSWHGFQFNLLRNDEKLCKAIFEVVFVPSLLAWVLLGADSTADQLSYFLLNFPKFLLGKISFNGLLDIYNSYYGLGTHWSAAVIYSLLLIGVSKHIRDKLDVKNSENLCVTTGIVALAIATFEFFWQVSYAVFQKQPWVLWYRFPQARILLQNMIFVIAGSLVLIALIVGYDEVTKKYYMRKDIQFNFDKFTIISFVVTVGLILLWWFYPFPTPQLTVGNWVSTSYFPQTMYTIQPNPYVAYGIMYYVEDAGVHLLNNLTKIFMTLTFYSLFRLKRRE